MNKIEQITALLLESPADSFLLHALALEQIKMADDLSAQKTFEHLLSQNPDYVGSYYHLAKLHERNGRNEAAIKVYETGMDIARKLDERHALGELRAAWEDLTDEY